MGTLRNTLGQGAGTEMPLGPHCAPSADHGAAQAETLGGPALFIR